MPWCVPVSAVPSPVLLLPAHPHVPYTLPLPTPSTFLVVMCVLPTTMPLSLHATSIPHDTTNSLPLCGEQTFPTACLPCL